MSILLQFIFRTTFGLALAMALTSSRQVSSGYFRNHLYVLLGLNVLAAAVTWIVLQGTPWFPIAIACLCYLGSVLWLYERPTAGKTTLAVIATVALFAAWLAPRDVGIPRETVHSQVGSNSQAGENASDTGADQPVDRPLDAVLLERLDPVAGGLVLGFTLAAMFLGHWYLNAPGMQMAPLRRLVFGMGAAIVLRAILAAAGLGRLVMVEGLPGQVDLLFVSLRWLSGIVAAALLVWMTWKTLDIPNTQSATGILYVGVIVVFAGELTAMLVSVKFIYPL